MSLLSAQGPQQYQALIHHIEQTPSGVLYVWLKPLSTFNYIHCPGQYLSLKIGEEFSFFSIASLPVANSLLELHLQIQDDVKIQFLLNAFMDKKAVSIEYPYGVVEWPQAYSNGFFICRGTGFAPVKALAEIALHRNTSKPVTLFWEADSFKEFYFKEWLEIQLKQHGHFKVKLFSATQSNQSELEKFVNLGVELHQTSILEYMQLNPLNVDPESTWFYLCASPNRVYSWVDLLLDKGFALDQMGSDVFEYAPRS